MKNKSIFIVVGVLILIVAAVGYTSFFVQGTESVINMQDLPLFSPVAQTEQNEALSTREGWVTQKNLEVGIQIERPDNWKASQTKVQTVGGSTITFWSAKGPGMDPAIIYFFSTDMSLSQAKKLKFGNAKPDLIEFQDVAFGGIKGAVQRWDYSADGPTVYIGRLTLIEKAGVVYGSYEPNVSKEDGKVLSDIVWSMTPIR